MTTRPRSVTALPKAYRESPGVAQVIVGAAIPSPITPQDITESMAKLDPNESAILGVGLHPRHLEGPTTPWREFMEAMETGGVRVLQNNSVMLWEAWLYYILPSAKSPGRNIGITHGFAELGRAKDGPKAVTGGVTPRPASSPAESVTTPKRLINLTIEHHGFMAPPAHRPGPAVEYRNPSALSGARASAPKVETSSVTAPSVTSPTGHDAAPPTTPGQPPLEAAPQGDLAGMVVALAKGGASTRKIAEILTTQGQKVSHMTVARVLQKVNAETKGAV